MSISFVNRKFEALAAKEKAVNDYYDPLNRKGKQHPNIKDLRDDYNEDLQNYGFSKYQLKKEIEEQKQTERGHTEQPEISNYQFESTNALQTYQTIQRPGTALPVRKPPPIRPTTAPFRSEQFEIQESEEPMYKTLNIERPKESKFWRNTKKFDTASQSQIRNHSALQRIMIDSGDTRTTPDEHQQKQLIEDRINVGKLGQLNDHQIYQKKRLLMQERKHSPTDKDKFHTYIGFQEQLRAVLQKDEPRQVPGLPRPQRAAVKQQPNRPVSAIARPKSSVQFSGKGDVTKQPILILETLRKMQALVLQQRFTAVNNVSHSEDLFSMKWGAQVTSQVMPYGLVIVEVKTMNLVHLESVFLSEENKLIYVQKGDFHFVDFRDIMHSLFSASDQLDSQLFPSNNLFYLMMYQGTLKHQTGAGLVYEKFYYDGPITLPIGKQIENLYAAFYLRFLLLQDQAITELGTLLSRTQFIIQKKSKFPQQLTQFLTALKDRQIAMQDRIGACYIIDLVDMLADCVLTSEPQQPVQTPGLEVQLENMLHQQQRPSTATLKRPPSVQTIEKMNRISQASNAQVSPQYHAQRPQTAGSKYFSMPQRPVQPIDTDFNQLMMQPPVMVTPYHALDFQDTATIMRPVSSQYAMSLNFGDENLVNVLQLISTKTNSSSVYKPPKQGLRPQSAVKKIAAPQVKPQSATSSQQKLLYGEQQNLRFVKKVRGMTNHIVIKGTRVLEE